MKAARIAATLPLLAAGAALSGCQSKGATAVVPVVMAPYAAPAVTISPAPAAQASGRAAGGGAVQATPVAATAMNPAAAQYNPQHGPRPTTTPIAAYNISNMPVAATPVITVPTMMAPAPVAATPVAATPAYMPAPAATMATPVMMMAPAQPQAGGGQVMYMMMAPASGAQPMAAQPIMAQPVVAAPTAPPAAPPQPQPQPQLMTLPTYGAPVYVMPQAR